MARNPKPVRRLYKTIQANFRSRSYRPLWNPTYDSVRAVARPVVIWEWRKPCDHPNEGVTYRDATTTVWACPDCETEWEEVV